MGGQAVGIGLLCHQAGVFAEQGRVGVTEDISLFLEEAALAVISERLCPCW